MAEVAPSKGSYSIEFFNRVTNQKDTLGGMEEAVATRRFEQMKTESDKYADVVLIAPRSMMSPSEVPHSYSASHADALDVSDEEIAEDTWKADMKESLTELKSKLDEIDLGKSKGKSKFKPVADNVKALIDVALRHASSSSSSKADLGAACLALQQEIDKLVIGKASESKSTFKAHCDEFVKSSQPMSRGSIASREIKYNDDDPFGGLYTALKENYFHANREEALAKAQEIYTNFREHATKDDSYLIFGGSTALCALGYEVGPGDFDVYTNDTKGLQAALRSSGYGDEIKLSQSKRFAIGEDGVPSLELPGAMISAKESALKRSSGGPESNPVEASGIMVVSPEYLLQQYQAHPRSKDEGKIDFLKGL
ncbi:hypothetical protein SG34_029900 [Thalassomonas viridans]|uniref:Uncharacterized protein n=1 Tax=Thalassomonas viridans TaxID=137584 RepID=A0AAE9Z912_9GAMM|nr:hypothetical protein [Thalassomonas viridans]WDE08996.1 hypothetical protein SG34_029900 [Thalassomonas viridans]